MRPDSRLGQTIGSYRLLEVLGEGGMARVYRAEHASIGKEAALKLLHPDHAIRTDSVGRFFQEAKAVNQIRHENIIDIFDFGETELDEPFFVMELLSGEPLQDLIKRESPLPLDRVIHVALQLCDALDATHRRGIIHRDLKGGNVFLTTRAGQRDFVKLLDFGIAKQSRSDANATANAYETKSGAMIGTPIAISPEQARGEKVGPETDIYALGVLLYQMATGGPPFYHENPIFLALMHIDQEVPPLRQKNPHLPEEFERIVLRCLAKKQTERYHSTLDLAEDIRALSRGPGVKAAPPRSGYTSTLEVGPLPALRADAPERRVSVITLAAASVLLVAAVVSYLALRRPEAPGKPAALLAQPTPPPSNPTPSPLPSEPNSPTPTSTPLSQPANPSSPQIAPANPSPRGSAPAKPKTAEKTTKTPTETPPAETPKNPSENKTVGAGTVNPFQQK